MKIVKKFVQTAKRYLKNRCDVFVMYPERLNHMNLSWPIQLLNKDKDISLKGSLESFSDRIQSGERCYYVEIDGDIIAYGWRSSKPEVCFYVWEIARSMKLSTDAYVLYDFWVNPKYRNQGIYKNMLQKIIYDIGHDGKSIIFAETNNVASKKAIGDIGFERCGQISFVRKKVVI